MADLLQTLEENNIPAPGPIEQRWSSSSSADLSPASPADGLDQIHSWVGIIMYLPEDDPDQRAKVTDRCASVPVKPCLASLLYWLPKMSAIVPVSAWQTMHMMSNCILCIAILLRVSCHFVPLSSDDFWQATIQSPDAFPPSLFGQDAFTNVPFIIT